MMMTPVEEGEEESDDSSGGSMAGTPTTRTTSPLHRTVGETTRATLVAPTVAERADTTEVVVVDGAEEDAMEEERPTATRGHAVRGRMCKSSSA